MLAKKILLVLIYLNTFLTDDDDYYRLLRVSKRATIQQIKRSFKKLSRKYHPDKNTENLEETQKTFENILKAYDVLKDEEKKKIYDEKGEEGIRQLISSQAQSNYGQNQENEQIPKRKKEDLYFENSLVIEIDVSNLVRFKQRNEAWLLFFYKLGKKSKEKAEIIKELAQKFIGFFRIGVINCKWEKEICEDDFNFDFEEQEMDSVLPSLKGFSGDNTNNTHIDFQNNFTLNKIASFAVNLMENFVQIVDNSTYLEFNKMNYSLQKVLLFSKSSAIPPLFKLLSKEYRERILFGIVKEKNNTLADLFNIQSLPSFLLITDFENYKADFHKGDFNKEKLIKFLNEILFKPKPKFDRRIKGNPGKIFELTMNILKTGNCGNKDSIMCCLMIINKENENSTIEGFEKLAFSFKDEAINFFYIFDDKIKTNSIFQKEDNTGIYMIKAKRNKYAKFQGNFFENSEEIKFFIENCLGGNAKFLILNDNLQNALELNKKDDL